MNIRPNWKAIFEFPPESLSARNLLSAYFIVNCIGLIVFTMLVATVLAKFFQPSDYIYEGLYPWARPPNGSISKLTILLQFIFSLLALFLYSAIFFHLSKLVNHLTVVNKDRVQKIVIYFFIAVIINGALFTVDKENFLFLILLSTLWVIFFPWTLYSFFKSNPHKISLPNWFFGAVLFVILAQYSSIFVPLITRPFQVENNYINIPEKTILKSGKIIDNIDYVNAHNIAGFKISDPRNTSKHNLDLPTTPDEQAIETFNDDKQFTVMNLFTPSEETLDFLKINAKDLLNQVKAGWFFYHHSYNFGPMNAISLGASAYQQTMVYGWLSTVTQSKVLDLFGMSNYQGYFKLYFSEYLAYFSIFLLGVWAIFKRLSTLVFAAILSISALSFLGIELIRLAPGFNPVRHIFDVPVFYLAYRYLELNRKFYLILACLLAVFSILWSKDFGLFLSLSVGGAFCFKGIKQRPFSLTPFFLGSITVFSGILLYFYPMPGANPTAHYMLLGIGSPPIGSGVVFGLLVIIGLLFAISIAIKQSEAHTIITVGMAFYFVLSLVYFLWYPSLHHILGVAPVFILWLVAIFHGWVEESENTEKRQSIILILLLILLYLPASASFYWRMNSYNKTFKNHQMYQWTFDKARLLSTMDPILFEGAVKHIRNYSHNDNGIFIISKYDHILPILAGKYSAMPYNELPTNLVSPREVNIAIDAILKTKPEFLFIDTYVNDSILGEISKRYDPVSIKLGLYLESRGRALVLKNLNQVYFGVLGSYGLCIPGQLISVYCRKS